MDNLQGGRLGAESRPFWFLAARSVRTISAGERGRPVEFEASGRAFGSTWGGVGASVHGVMK